MYKWEAAPLCPAMPAWSAGQICLTVEAIRFPFFPVGARRSSSAGLGAKGFCEVGGEIIGKSASQCETHAIQ